MKAVVMNVIVIGPDNDWVALPPADHGLHGQQPMNGSTLSMSGAQGLHLRRLRLV
ncbi:MAG: hypothetical protein ACRDUV_01930 [Pseudonocardiaceae bacterium]